MPLHLLQHCNLVAQWPCMNPCLLPSTPFYAIQGNVIVKPNLLIFKLIAGYGYLFFVMPYNMGPYWVVSKWFIAP